MEEGSAIRSLRWFFKLDRRQDLWCQAPCHVGVTQQPRVAGKGLNCKRYGCFHGSSLGGRLVGSSDSWGCRVGGSTARIGSLPTACPLFACCLVKRVGSGGHVRASEPVASWARHSIINFGQQIKGQQSKHLRGKYLAPPYCSPTPNGTERYPAK